MSNISSVPIGTIAIFPSNILPAGWVVCDGATYTESQIPKNFRTLADNLNVPKTATSLKLPDLRDRFILSCSSGTPTPGTLGGPGNHVHAVPQQSGVFPTSMDGSHSHGYPGWYYNSTVSGDSRTTIQSSTGSVTRTSSNGEHVHSATVTFGQFDTSPISTEGWLNRPKHIAMYYIIKIGIG